MPQYLCTYSPARPTFTSDATEAESEAVGAHFRYLQQALEAGRLMIAGRTQDEPPMGIAVFEAESEGAAQAFVRADPAVAAGVFRATVRPYRVALLRGGAGA